MTKPELVSFIMARTTEYKKTHLMEKYKAELETIAASFSAPEETANTSAPSEEGRAADAPIAAAEDNIKPLPLPAQETSESESEDAAPDSPGELPDDLKAAIIAAYDENAKIVKGRRLDKDEFKEAAIERATAQAIAEQINDQAIIKEMTLSIMRYMLTDLVAFCPMNDNERKMLETIPALPDYENTESQVNGKGFLKKVEEIHNISVNTSRALMVSLKRKKYITIGGGKKTFIVLLERGIRHLNKIS